MTPGIYERNAYSFLRPMWHLIGTVGEKPMSAIQIMNEHFDGGFPVVTRPDTVTLNVQTGVTFNDEGNQVPVYEMKPVESGYYSVIRGATKAQPMEIVFDTCTEKYNPLQPIELAQAFDKSVEQYVETMAFLRQGREMFITWKLPTFEVKKDDPIEMYGGVVTGFDTKRSSNIFTTIYRIVCSNTLAMAENWAEKNKGRNQGMIWTGKGTNRNLLRDIELWLEHVQGNALKDVETTREFFKAIADVPVSEQDANAILMLAFPNKPDTSDRYPSRLRQARQEKIQATNEGVQRLREGILNLYLGAGTAITPDAYGLLNATTEWLCHGMKSKKPIAESVMFGNRRAIAMEMIYVLRDFVK